MYPHRPGCTQSGKPTIRGTRITVHDIPEYLTSWISQDKVLADFPNLSSGNVWDALLLRG